MQQPANKTMNSKQVERHAWLLDFKPVEMTIYNKYGDVILELGDP